jgi:outer membrane protein TolC
MNTGVSISVPIFSGNSISTRIQQAKIAVDKQESEYLTQLQDLSVQLQSMVDQLNNYQEVLDAQVSVVRARSSLIRSKYDAYIEQANLKALLGTLDTNK